MVKCGRCKCSVCRCSPDVVAHVPIAMSSQDLGLQPAVSHDTVELLPTSVVVLQEPAEIKVKTQIKTVKVKSSGSIMEKVEPILHICCCYCAITPSVQITCSCAITCMNCLCSCCREGAEGCICCESKTWQTCTGMTCVKCVLQLCCVACASAVPCQKNIPCRITIFYCTIFPTCGCCKSVDHGAAIHGIQHADGAPPSLEMSR